MFFNFKEYLKYDRKLDKEKIIAFNKQLIDEYPFLLPRNRFSDKVAEDYDYTYTELIEMPDGWLIAFGNNLLKELKDELIKLNCLDDYRVIQIKEKYGELRWYGSFYTDTAEKYCDISRLVCQYCGKQAKIVTKGWVSYLCEDCYSEVSGAESSQDKVILDETKQKRYEEAQCSLDNYDEV